MAAVKFLWMVLGIVFTLGLADSFAHLTYKMATAAAHAHMYDQISYSAYTRLLFSKPHASHGSHSRKTGPKDPAHK